MPTYAENLVTIRDGIAAALAAADPSRKDYSLDGESVSYTRWWEVMTARLTDYNRLIDQASPRILITRHIVR